MFTLRQAEEIARGLGAEVTLAAFHSLPLDDLQRLHRISFAQINLRLDCASTQRPYELFRRSPLKLSAYDVLALPSFARWARRAIKTADPDWVWFHDDIPAVACDLLSGRRVGLYVHYPLAGRDSEICPAIGTTRGLAETVNDAMLNAFRSRFVCNDPTQHSAVIWANSNVTSRAIRSVWGAESKIVYPYQYSPPQSTGPKEPVIVSIGSFSRGKNFETLLASFSATHLPRDGWTLVLAGHARDSRYISHLRHLAAQCEGSRSIEIQVDIAPSAVEGLLTRASIVVHPAIFEPFGIAFLEGMAHADAGVAFAGPWSGPWIDGLDAGQYGIGFTDRSNLATALQNLADGPLSTYQSIAAKRSAVFVSELLSEQILRAMRT